MLIMKEDNKRSVTSGVGVVENTVKTSVIFKLTVDLPTVHTAGRFLSMLINMLLSRMKYCEKLLVCYRRRH